MKFLTKDTSPAEFIGSYGPNWRQGLLSEHFDSFVKAGGEFRPAQAHIGWAVVEGRGYPILCSELIRVDTEDGPMSGRCGEFAYDVDGCCASHAR